jgi:hypothetical protein
MLMNMESRSERCNPVQDAQRSKKRAHDLNAVRPDLAPNLESRLSHRRYTEFSARLLVTHTSICEGKRRTGWGRIAAAARELSGGRDRAPCCQPGRWAEARHVISTHSHASTAFSSLPASVSRGGPRVSTVGARARNAPACLPRL